MLLTLVVVWSSEILLASSLINKAALGICLLFGVFLAQRLWCKFKKVCSLTFYNSAPRINQKKPLRQIPFLDSSSKYSHRHGLDFMNSGGRGPLLSSQGRPLSLNTWISPGKHMCTREELARRKEIPAQDHPARQRLSAHVRARRATVPDVVWRRRMRPESIHFWTTCQCVVWATQLSGRWLAAATKKIILLV